MSSRLPLWIIALGTTLGMQSVASFLNQSLPIIAPLLMAGAGLAPERIGNISSLNSLGTVLFLMFGAPVLLRLGPIRSLQMGALLAVAGLALAASGYWPLLIVAALLMGAGYAPSPPAGSKILAATAPPDHRTLIFSIKQAGAPAGGALAGLILAPVAAIWGWSAALLVSIALGLAACLVISPVRLLLDGERDSTQKIGLRQLFHPTHVAAPFHLLGQSPTMLSVTALAFSFAAVQGALTSFSITYLFTGLGLSLEQAGFAFACMQVAGVVARILLGWLADRTGRPAHNLTVQAFCAAVMMWFFAGLPVHPALWGTSLICAGTGFLAASWNGIYMAEIARLSPPDRITEVTSSSTVVTFLGYIVGPSLYSLLVTIWGGWRMPFLVIAAQLAVMALVQTVVLARRGPHARK